MDRISSPPLARGTSDIWLCNKRRGQKVVLHPERVQRSERPRQTRRLPRSRLLYSLPVSSSLLEHCPLAFNKCNVRALRINPQKPPRIALYRPRNADFFPYHRKLSQPAFFLRLLWLTKISTTNLYD